MVFWLYNRDIAVKGICWILCVQGEGSSDSGASASRVHAFRCMLVDAINQLYDLVRTSAVSIHLIFVCDGFC